MKHFASWIMFVLLLAISLEAKQSGGYSIQILSYPKGTNVAFKQLNKDSSCYRVVRKGYEAVRCGCVDRFDEAKRLLSKYRKSYKGSFVANCDRDVYRKGRQTPQYTNEKKKGPKTVRKHSSHRYSIQILSAPADDKRFAKYTGNRKCYRVIRKGFAALRCGCYRNFADADKALKNYKRTYKSAFVGF